MTDEQKPGGLEVVAWGRFAADGKLLDLSRLSWGNYEPLCRAEPGEARIRSLEAKLARAVEGLQRMEWACEQLASTRSSAAYEQMISDGQAQELLELDNARREARQTLAALQQEGE